MQTIICDVCKKKMEDPQGGRTFFYYPKYGICEPCKDILEADLRKQARTREPFSYEWFYKYINDTIEKGVQKGKF